MPTFGERIVHAWNAFTSRDPTSRYYYREDFGMAYSSRPDKHRLTRGNERSIVNAVYNRIAIDAASIKMVHAKLDENEHYVETIKSGLNYCLNTEANIDQTGRAFMQDVVMSMMDEGCVAIVPVDATIDPKKSASFEVKTLRTAKIIQWFPRHVRVRVYNDRVGRYEEIVVPKSTTAIIENPLYSVMNEPNSTLNRLIRKLNLLDAVDEQSSSGKLDLIIQLPYVVKTDSRRAQAEQRRKDIEMQLSSSKYGIAYTDGTEKITQLNRAVENNLLKQVEYLTSMLYSQLGMTEDILKGTADEKAMLNYQTRTIEPILSAIADELERKFISKTARTQLQAVMFFRDPFRLVPVNDMAEIVDKFTRNEILSSNEVRAILGYKPSDDPRADELRNKNLNDPNAGMMPMDEMGEPYPEEEMNPLDTPMSEVNSESVATETKNPMDMTLSEIGI